MPSQLVQTNEIFKYRKENSFYASFLIFTVSTLDIMFFDASFSDISILIIMYLAFLFMYGTLNETVSVSNQNIIIKYNVLCFSAMIKKSWQEITHVTQQNHKGKIKLRLNLLDAESKGFSSNYIELSEPDNEGKMYDFICLCSAIKSQASSHDIAIDDQKSTEKPSRFKKFLSNFGAISFIIISWVFLSRLSLFTPHAIHPYTLIIWLIVLFVSPYFLSFLYLKHIAKQKSKHSEKGIIFVNEAYLMKLVVIVVIVLQITYIASAW